MLHDGLFYEVHNDKVKCLLCPHNCTIGNNQFGLCFVRKNEDGIIRTINNGDITSMALDPIEKKPLYHFKPGQNILSVGTFGCNFTCDFCQNYSIAHFKAESEYMSPDKLIEICLSIEDNIGIAFTYNEPTVWYEYVYETSKMLKEKCPDYSVVLVTNGYIELEPLLELLPYVDAMNIDLKSFNEDYYMKICGGDVNSVLKTIEASYKKCHVEITTLLVNGLNDSKVEVEEIASFLSNLDKSIPLHLTRYFPMYKMNRPATNIEVMLEAKEIASKYLNYVYLGNINNIDTSTYCPSCGKLLIERGNFYSKVFIDDNVCPECGKNINVLM